MLGRQRLHAGYHALVARATGQLGQALVGSLDEAGAGLTHTLHKAAHARVTAAGVDMDFGDRLEGWVLSRTVTA